jgi:hypothetical protein
VSTKSRDMDLIHSSEESDWRTEEALVTALHEEEYGGIEIDLAADTGNRKFPIWLGPGSPHGENALAVDWIALLQRLGLAPIGFLNPPFSRKKSRAYRTGRIQDTAPGTAGLWIPHPTDPIKATWYEVETWARKCWAESRRGMTIYAVLPFAPQTDWYRKYVYGHMQGEIVDGRYPQTWAGHAALEERRFPHRLNFLRPDGSPAANAGVNSVVIKWGPAAHRVGPWAPASFYWSHR